MIDKTIQDIEARIQTAKHLTFAQRKELQALVADLKAEVTRLSQTHGEDADSIAAFARVTANEGLREARNPQLLRIAVEGVRASVAQFEKTHPSLVMTANAISTYFSNLGI